MPKPEIRFTKDGVELRFEYLFKLGLPADLAGRLLTGKFAPFAWMEIVYFIPSEGGTARIELRSSLVPSVHWYVEQKTSGGQPGRWKNVDRTEMEKLSAKEFGKFVDTHYESKGPANGYPLQSYAICIEEGALER
ncbi:MAG: hypothetical protein ACKV2U_33420 [Bryobacteraceae bacterium]